ncbi:MAG: type II toxin-antitoxin system ParD family antitoxin [Leptolyngbyaceae cyanobacterium]
MIELTSAQEQIVQSQVVTGQYASAEEVIDVALELLQFLDSESIAWLKETQQKIQVGLDEIERGEGVDGAEVMDRLLQRFQQARHG